MGGNALNLVRAQRPRLPKRAIQESNLRPSAAEIDCKNGRFEEGFYTIQAARDAEAGSPAAQKQEDHEEENDSAGTCFPAATLSTVVLPCL
jgi:hypothetical protein